MRYHSTRDCKHQCTAAQAILQGLAPDGGLYVPESFPRVDFEDYGALSYQEMAARILALYFTDFSLEELRAMTKEAYGKKFEEGVLALRLLGENRAYLELWHGPTLAFKDMALALLPLLMKKAMERTGRTERVLVLTATSGDTGKAAMEGFSGRTDMGVLVFYPYQGISLMQRQMMLGQEGRNVQALALRGDFDACQSGVKQLFTDREIAAQLAEEHIFLSSANSINIGRLIPQIVYYVWAYLELVKRKRIRYGDPLNLAVPTGNFGDVLAAYYAREMGLPLGEIAIASNSNKVLYDFAESGLYDRRRKLVKTISPSMDILISSNLERYLYLQDPRPDHIRQLMDQLAREGSFTFPPDLLYPAAFADETACREEIRQVFYEQHYLLDPHTAVAAYGADQLFGDQPCLVVSTASPYKFAGSLLSALSEGQQKRGSEKESEKVKAQSSSMGSGEEQAKVSGVDAKGTEGLSSLFNGGRGPEVELQQLSELSGLPIPEALQKLMKKSLRPEEVIEADEMKKVLLEKVRSLYA